MEKLIITIILTTIMIVFLWLSGRPVFLNRDKFKIFLEKYVKYTQKINPGNKPNYIILKIGSILGFLFILIISIGMIFFIIALWR
jgi:hypothetical protein